MADSMSETAATALASSGGAAINGAANFTHSARQAARRKVRKGTRSCWECKRRKVRCIMSSPDDVVCQACESHGSACVSQEMPEVVSVARKNGRQLGERIARVEDLMNGLLTGREAPNAIDSDRALPQRKRGKTRIIAMRPNGSKSSKVPSHLAPVENNGETDSSSSLLTPASSGVAGQPEIETARQHLLAALPSRENLEILAEESFHTNLHNTLINNLPHSKLTVEALSATPTHTELPTPNTHPTILARMMLIYSITLQDASNPRLAGISEPLKALMHRMVTAAKTWVTTNEDLQGTVEGVICIILEGIFEMNLGNLRRAWVVYRRAMVVAQLMGLHRSPMPPLKRVDPRLEAKPEFLWFRIVLLDRYLSLLLGLPQGYSEKSDVDMSSLRDEPPLGKFERLLTGIASRILERNERAFAPSELTTTKSVDADLLRLSAMMPPSFWGPTELHKIKPGTPETLLETIRLSAQIYYYALLNYLHLPYMMGLGDNTDQEYSKITCINASREILGLFNTHRIISTVSVCSRCLDFIALLACMTLLLAYIDAHYHREETYSLAHQRLGDLARLNQALELMNVVPDGGDDLFTRQSAQLVHKLLEIEASAAEGHNYSTKSTRGNGDTQEDQEDGEELHLHIPYLGAIKIVRQNSSPRGLAQPHEISQQEPLHQGQFAESTDWFHSVPSALATHLSDIQGAHHETTHSGNLPGLAQPIAHVQVPGYGHSGLQPGNTMFQNVAPELQFGLPPLTAGGDDWAFQGVDLAFFDSVTRGTFSVYGTSSEPQWIDESL